MLLVAKIGDSNIQGNLYIQDHNFDEGSDRLKIDLRKRIGCNLRRKKKAQLDLQTGISCDSGRENEAIQKIEGHIYLQYYNFHEGSYKREY